MKLFETADEYCKKGNWKTLALLKVCLFAMGIIIGMQVPKEKKKWVLGVSCLAFLATYIPLMGRFFHLYFQKED